MKHALPPKLGITSPGRWMEDSLKRIGMPKNRLASLLDVSPSQLSKILSGQDAMPRRLDIHACRVFGLSDTETAIVISQINVYNAYNNLNVTIDKYCKNYPKENINAFAYKIKDLLVDVAISLYERSSLIDQERRLTRLWFFLIDAEILIRDLMKMHLGDKNVFISPDNIAYHLRQPLSSYVGALIKLGSSDGNEYISHLKNLIMVEFQNLAKKPYNKTGNIDYIQQHAVHMLSRYGDESDRLFTVKYLKVDDIFAKRMALFGMSLGGNPDVDNTLFSLMRDDVNFLQAVASFDGVHYGDANLINERIPSSIDSLNITISNSLSYITQEVFEENLDLNFIKLTAFLQKFGPSIFSDRHLFTIKQILVIMSQGKNLSISRREFQRCFQQLLKM